MFGRKSHVSQRGRACSRSENDRSPFENRRATGVSSECGLSSGPLAAEFAHVDLAGDGGGDQGGAAFLETADSAFGFVI